FVFPHAVSVSPKNRIIFVADQGNNRVQAFTHGREYLWEISGLKGPQGVTALPDGRVLIADTDNHRVLLCGQAGPCELFAGVTGQRGSDAEHLSFPRSIAVDRAGRVYVADHDNHRVQVFDASGKYLSTIGGVWGAGEGQMRNPSGLAFGPDGRLYVTDYTNQRVLVYEIQ
ncbi:MAG: hypothetical protein GX616_00995, partial [Planctomycetes bacterium]|nr:hypothetical protein [Planctomycetota bacterium]